MKVSLILPSFCRAPLLELGLSSIAKYRYDFSLEIVVINDGLVDSTETVCNAYRGIFNIKYIFTGQRNKDKVMPRVPGFAINAGVNQCSGDVIVLSCPEVYHLNNCLNTMAKMVMNGRYLVVPESMYFDDIGQFTQYLTHPVSYTFVDLLGSLTSGVVGYEAAAMPYLLCMQKEEFMAIRGYDEDFTGYAADDNDLVSRLLHVGCEHCRVDARIIHLYHGARCDAQLHPENPEWAHNYKLFVDRQGQDVRNVGREWGKG